MTQATVNVCAAVKNLNPDAQQFSSSDFNNGTVAATAAGSVPPSDYSYTDYADSGTGSYLRQQPSHVYQVDPSTIDVFHQQQQQQQQQQTDSNFAVSDHAAMLETVEQPPHSSTVLNSNHPHHQHLQTHSHQTMPDEEHAHRPTLTPEQLRQTLRQQLEYYFSRANMATDTYLQSKMDADNYVSISIIADFKLVKRLTHDLQLIVDVLKELPSVEVDMEEKKVRPARKRCIIILRDVPLDATEDEVFELFSNDRCPVSSVDCERVLSTAESNCWYVTFNSEEDAQNAFLYLTRENVSIRGQKVLARMKARMWQKSASASATNPTTPVSPPNVSTSALISTAGQQVSTAINGGTTSPPPASLQSYSQQQSAPQTSAFVPQQQQQQHQTVQPQPLPQYSSHPQPQFNQQALSSQQQQAPQQQPSVHQQPQYATSQHTPVYMHTAPTGHPSQQSLLGAMQSQSLSAAGYRHPMHSSVGPHLAAQLHSTGTSQHPNSIENSSALQQHLRMSYQNFAGNPHFERAWATAAHQQSLQGHPTLSFTTTTQQPGMQSYPTSIHPQTQFIAANHPVFSAANVWYMSPPQTYSTSDPYSSMSYNGANKPKPRMQREYPPSSKPRNSAKPLGSRNSRHEGLSMNNEPSADLLDYCHHSTPHSEGSSSPVPRAEAVINRGGDPTATPLQHIQAFPANIAESIGSGERKFQDNIDHYHHQPTTDSLYTNANSHVQQQQRSNSNSSPPQEQIVESVSSPSTPPSTSSQIQTNLGKFPVQSPQPISSYSTSDNTNTNKSNQLNYQPLEQRKPPGSSHPSTIAVQEQSSVPSSLSIGDNQQQSNKKHPPTNNRLSNEQQQQQQPSIRPLMPRENRPISSSQGSNRSSNQQQQSGRTQQQPLASRSSANGSGHTSGVSSSVSTQQQPTLSTSQSTPLSVTIPPQPIVPKVPSATYYNQTSNAASPQQQSSPNPQQHDNINVKQNLSSQKAQQQQQSVTIDNSGHRTYADMLKLKQAPQQQQQQSDSTKSTISPTTTVNNLATQNETNELSSSRAESPVVSKVDSVSVGVVSSEINGPVSSSSSSDSSPPTATSSSHPPPPPPPPETTITDTGVARRNSSASDQQPQINHHHHHHQHSASPSHQPYNNNPRGGRGGRGGGNYRYPNDRRPGSGNDSNRGGGGGGGRGGGRRPMSGGMGPPTGPPFPSRGGGRGGSEYRGGGGRFFDRPRGGNNYSNSNAAVHRFPGNAGNVEPQAHYVE